jgi:hypothetical protein
MLKAGDRFQLEGTIAIEIKAIAWWWLPIRTVSAWRCWAMCQSGTVCLSFFS